MRSSISNLSIVDLVVVFCRLHGGLNVGSQTAVEQQTRPIRVLEQNDSLLTTNYCKRFLKTFSLSSTYRCLVSLCSVCSYYIFSILVIVENAIVHTKKFIEVVDFFCI